MAQELIVTAPVPEVDLMGALGVEKPLHRCDVGHTPSGFGLETSTDAIRSIRSILYLLSHSVKFHYQHQT